MDSYLVHNVKGDILMLKMTLSPRLSPIFFHTKQGIQQRYFLSTGAINTIYCSTCREHAKKHIPCDGQEPRAMVLGEL